MTRAIDRSIAPVDDVKRTLARARMAVRWFVLPVLALVVVGSPRWAEAHPVGVSRGEYAIQDGKVYAGVTFARPELGAALPWLRGHDETESPLSFEEHRSELGRWLEERLLVTSAGAPCRGSFDGMRFDGDGVSLALSYVCPSGGERAEIDARFVSELDRAHRHLVAVSVGHERFDRVATRAATRMVFEWGTRTGEPGAGREAPKAIAVAPLVRMGVEHILTGYDHLLFLFGILLVGGPLRSLVGAITAFTVAHSLTLALAALDVWSPSPRLVEPCIALSIAYVGIENEFVRDARGR